MNTSRCQSAGIIILCDKPRPREKDGHQFEGPAGGTATAAGQLQIGDRVTWLARWNDGKPSKIVTSRSASLTTFPGTSR